MKEPISSIVPAALALASCASLSHAGLVGHWKFDETSGTVAADEKAANPGTAFGGVTINQPGKAGGAYQFDGTTNGRVEIGSATFLPDLTATPALTMAGWIKTTNVANAQSVIFIGANSASDQYYQLATKNPNGEARGVVRSGNFTEALGTVVTDGEWHHLATTIEITGGSKTIKTYVDGALANTLTQADTPPSPLNDVEIGRLGRSSPADFFNGLIDDVQVYDEVLADTEIEALFDNPGRSLEGDSDGDEMPDLWEIAHGTNPDVPDGEIDNDANGGPDGLSNLEEYQNGTDPQEFDSDGDTLSDGIEVKALHPSGFASDPNSVDGDNDGVTDVEEHNGVLNVAFSNAATDPLDDDSDDDGMPDGYELTCNTPGTALDPNDDGTTDATQDPYGDRDVDGLENIAEFDPFQGPNTLSPRTRADLFDTDGDGYSDKAEDNYGSWASMTATGTNPVIPDSDGDGIDDGDENPDTSYAAGSNSGSDPNLPDSDFDGFSDGAEFSQNFDPTDESVHPELPASLATENFDYAEATPINALSGGDGWITAWFNDLGQYVVTDGAAAGQSQRAPGDTTTFATDRAFRSFPEVGSGTLYLTFSASVTATSPTSGNPGGISTAGISLFSGGTTGTEWTFLGIRNDFFRLDGASSGNANDRSTAAGTATAMTPVRFVLEIIFDPSPGGIETFNAYIFPDDQIPAELPAVPTLTTSYNIGDGVRIDTLRLFDNDDVAGTFDNIALVTDFSEIAGEAAPVITSVAFDGSHNLVIDFLGKAITSYDVTKSPDLTTPFGPLTVPQSVMTDISGAGQATIPASEASEAREFYRLEEVVE
ncbi:LamG domain-containing protein [Luteolibacter marinus]|uniref:LamG domain-containing protein n=1 Tax=Luteolibacter marinus TaxID=2776705 RepID=UPI0018676419|nr:LamG domain-containing protein [Luteolibacter marinus]